MNRDYDETTFKRKRRINEKRINGALLYMDYSPEALEACLTAILPDQCTLKDAEAVFNIPKRKICYKREQFHVRISETSLVFAYEKEKAV
ncbi:hypothetical protein AVEN_72749-1 [Araneus ventricosus]|uniref:HTH psq-type domain-containing protein n=1 Tax=Araneus ventricosus TaxID=182803 RepID=A0A4Y2DNP7_ARAVE|nr:hypothetical protein AVEN_72749-1 [Araneus ventricosus]